MDDALTMFFDLAFSTMWIAWVAYWWFSARGNKVTVRRESATSRLSYIFPSILGAVLLVAPRMPIPILGERFFPATAWRVCGAVGVTFTLLGLAFTVWARMTLGRNWSGTVTLKQDHELITRGPYRFVRHPIYTGLLLAFLGVAIARAEWRCLIGELVLALAFWHKLRIEERWMVEQFGDAYEGYRQRVAALVPYLI